jgi:hypothetical protein
MRSLLEISLPQTTAELNTFLCYLDKVILGKALEWSKRCYKSIVEAIDEAIAEHRDKGLSIEHTREVWYQTCLGPVRVRRRQYRDREKRYRYPLDELMGMRKHSHITVSVKELALELATTMPYRRSAEVLQKASAIDLPHQTIWRLMGEVANPYLEKAEQELERFIQTGEIPEGEGKEVARLIVEADGVMLSLQREKERKAEVKLGIAYEGWEKISKDRHRTVNKTAFAAVGGERDFWAGMSLKLGSKYDLSRVGETVVGGDGAPWVKEGVGYFNGRFQLDRYHLHRELTRALGKDRETKGMVWHACERGDVETCLQIMADAKRKVRGEQAERIARAYNYLKENRSGLADYRLALGEQGKGLRRTGAIEGNVDKLVVRRMKNQGMSWTLKGIRRLLCVRFLVLEEKLTSFLLGREAQKSGVTIPGKKMRRIIRRSLTHNPGEWLQVKLPALCGSHASRPWVTVLKAISEAQPL